MLEPVEITNTEALQERIEQGGVITVTRGLLAVPIAHRSECVQLAQIRVPNKQSLLVDGRLPNSPGNPRSP